MGRLRRSRMHKNIKDIKKKYRTRRKTKDLDQIVDDLKPENVLATVHMPVDGDLPGCGQFYCIHCTRHFQNDTCFNEHLKSKQHKKRVKTLLVAPYTQKEAEAAAGMGSYKAGPAPEVPSMEELHALRVAAKGDATEEPAVAATPVDA